MYPQRITIGFAKKPWTNLTSIIPLLDGEFSLLESLCKPCRLCPTTSLVQIYIYIIFAA
jgi:hypothetical protein